MLAGLSTSSEIDGMQIRQHIAGLKQVVRSASAIHTASNVQPSVEQVEFIVAAEGTKDLFRESNSQAIAKFED
jgi:hypothetical protein